MNATPPTNASTSDRLTTVLSYGMLLLLIYLVFRIYEPFLTALGWAAILAIFFYPLHRRLAGHFPANRAAMLSTLAVTILLIAPAIVVTTLFVREALSISRGVQHSFVEQQKAGRGSPGMFPGSIPTPMSSTCSSRGLKSKPAISPSG